MNAKHNVCLFKLIVDVIMIMSSLYGTFKLSLLYDDWNLTPNTKTFSRFIACIFFFLVLVWLAMIFFFFCDHFCYIDTIKWNITWEKQGCWHLHWHNILFLGIKNIFSWWRPPFEERMTFIVVIWLVTCQ